MDQTRNKSYTSDIEGGRNPKTAVCLGYSAVSSCEAQGTCKMLNETSRRSAFVLPRIRDLVSPEYLAWLVDTPLREMETFHVSQNP